MKKILLLFLLFLLPHCGQKKEDFYVVNVLDKKEYDDCHIKGSINVPFEDLEDYAKKKFDKDDTIILYCSNYKCSASKEGVKILNDMGLKKVYAYEAGMADWYQKGYPVSGSCKGSYLTAKNAPLPDEEDIMIITTEELKEKVDQKLAVS